MKKDEIQKIKIWNWTQSNPKVKILELTKEELQKLKKISSYGGDNYGTWSINDKTWFELETV